MDGHNVFSLSQSESDELDGVLPEMSDVPQSSDSDYGVPVSQHPLHDAVVKENLGRVQFLLSSGWDVNENHFCGVTPLHMACLAGHFEMAVYLIDRGAIVDAPSFERSTPLCQAAAGCHPRLVKLLLSLGASVNPPLLLSTPLHEACIRSGVRREDSTEVVRLLLEHNADVNRNDNHYGTPLHAACSKANPNIRVVELLLQSGANPNCLQYHRTPLHLVARYSKSYECTCALISYGANIDMRDKDDKRPIDMVPKDSSMYSVLSMCGRQPQSLYHLSRLAARKALGKEQLKHLDDLSLPVGLRNFLR